MIEVAIPASVILVHQHYTLNFDLNKGKHYRQNEQLVDIRPTERQVES